MADAEVTALAGAAKKVSDQYDNRLSPKMMAWLNLSIVAGSIYGTRVYAISARKQMAAAAGGGGSRPGPVKVDAKQKPNGAAQPEARTPADLYGLNYSGGIPGAAPDVM